MRKSHKQKICDKKRKRLENLFFKKLSHDMADELDELILEECILQDDLLKHWRI